MTAVAVVGAGAIGERHAAALVASGAHLVSIVDPDGERASTLAARLGQDVATCGSVGALPDRVEAAVVAVPNHLHEDVAVELLEQGRSVLVEKPMATTVAACHRMQEAATRGDAALHVGHMRRFLQSARVAKRLLATQPFGRLRGVRATEGNPYSWPVKSTYMFDAAQAGGGVLMDAGPHLVDLLRWWLPDLQVTEYRDDAFGGVEAESQIRAAAGGIDVDVELSRTRPLDNTVVLSFDEAQVVVGLRTNEISIKHGGQWRVRGLGADGFGPDEPQTLADLLRDQAQGWLVALGGGASDVATAAEGRATVELIERAYALRQPLVLPWVGTDQEVAQWMA